MYESPYWIGWSAGSWGTSWGYDVNVDEPPIVNAGGVEQKNRDKRARFVNREPDYLRDDERIEAIRRSLYAKPQDGIAITKTPLQNSGRDRASRENAQASDAKHGITNEANTRRSEVTGSKLAPNNQSTLVAEPDHRNDDEEALRALSAFLVSVMDD